MSSTGPDGKEIRSGCPLTAEATQGQGVLPPPCGGHDEGRLQLVREGQTPPGAKQPPSPAGAEAERAEREPSLGTQNLLTLGGVPPPSGTCAGQ